jgi:hypothetical protein
MRVGGSSSERAACELRGPFGVVLRGCLRCLGGGPSEGMRVQECVVQRELIADAVVH